MNGMKNKEEGSNFEKRGMKRVPLFSSATSLFAPFLWKSNLKALVLEVSSFPLSPAALDQFQQNWITFSPSFSHLLLSLPFPLSVSVFWVPSPQFPSRLDLLFTHEGLLPSSSSYHEITCFVSVGRKGRKWRRETILSLKIKSQIPVFFTHSFDRAMATTLDKTKAHWI